MKKIFFVGVFLLFTILTHAQWKLSGKITDKNSNETLVGANILVGKGQGTVTDINGNYSLTLADGKYTLTVSFVGYEPFSKNIEINGRSIQLDFQLESALQLDEVRIVSNLARTRETPVAFSTIEPKKLEEIIAAQDIPMVLNTTPGVYATTEGGGDGDAQVTIRGFSSRNVGVLLDGVPVNDMENGQVYWSNWFGLDAVTRSIQVQRGLGASRLALPSVGGTINIITKGFDSKKETSITQEIGSGGFTRTSFGLSTGLFGNGWSITAAGSYKQGNGWVDQTWTKGYFYYFKVDKRLGKHTVSASAYGAPQSHAQRSYMLPIHHYDAKIARGLGVPDSFINKVPARGIKYNQHWGNLARNANNPDVKSEPFNERVNEYHKPQFTLKDSWNLTDRLFISNIAYLSIGNGGGVRSKVDIAVDPETGQMNFQNIYFRNSQPTTVDASLDLDKRYASNYMRRQVNSHRWLGLLSTFVFDRDDRNTISGGVDLRTYRGIHYEEVYDLLGADYATFDYTGKYKDYYFYEDKSMFMLKEGDVNNFHNDGFVRWGGMFAQWEHKTDRFSSFVNLTGALSGYQRADYMIMRKADNVAERPDYIYKMIDGKKVEFTEWKWFPGITFKGGANYNFTKSMNAFVNLGYLSKAPRFNNVFDFNNLPFAEISNEFVKALEIGYAYNSTVFSVNLNSYYTIWENKPVDSAVKIPVETSPGEFVSYSANINGMDALHKGIELDFIYKITHNLDIQGLVSLGDWRWNSSDSVRIYDDNLDLKDTRFFDATGVHVGNSAQTQIAGEIRWEPIKNFYLKPKFTYFADYYADFDPMTLDGSKESYTWFDEETGEHGPARDSWKIPSYIIFDFHAGYNFKVKKNRVQVRFNILNLMDKSRIILAQDNDKYNGQKYDQHDAKSASVFFGLGRTYNMSLKYIF